MHKFENLLYSRQLVCVAHMIQDSFQTESLVSFQR